MKKIIFVLCLFLIIVSCNLKFITENEFKDKINSNTSGSATPKPFPGIYVRTTGNDANDGLTPATSKLTIQAGINAANAHATIKTVLVAAGTYNITTNLSFPGNDITLSGGYSTDFLTRDLASSTKSEIIYSGSATSAITVNARNNILIDGFHIEATSSATTIWGFFCQDSTNITIQNCNISIIDAGTDDKRGIGISNSTAKVINNTINIGPTTNTNYSINISFISTVEIYNNTINTAINNTTSNCVTFQAGGTIDCTARNNIFMTQNTSGTHNGFSGTATTLTEDYNVFVNFSAGTTGSGLNNKNYTGKSLFDLLAGYGTGDWSLNTMALLTTGGFTPAIDITQGGVNLTGTSLTTDKNGKPRTAGWSRGAYEQDVD